MQEETSNMINLERSSMNRLGKRNLNGTLLTYQQAAEKSNLGINTVMRLAKESGSLIKIGRISRVDWAKFYTYVSSVYGGEVG